MTVPGRKTAAAPISCSVGHVVGRDDAADHDHDVRAALLLQRLLQRGSRVRWPAASERDPDDVHVGVDRLLGDLLGGGEQRADVDVEAHVGEGADHDLLAAVVAVLAHLGDQDPGAATLGLLELLGGLDDLLHEVAAGRPGLVPEHAADRTDHGLVAAVDLLQRRGDLPDRGLGAGRVDGELQQVAVSVAPIRPLGCGQRLERAAHRRRRRARRAAARAWRSAGGRRRRCRPAARRAGPRPRGGRC